MWKQNPPPRVKWQPGWILKIDSKGVKFTFFENWGFCLQWRIIVCGTLSCTIISTATVKLRLFKNHSNEPGRKRSSVFTQKFQKLLFEKVILKTTPTHSHSRKSNPVVKFEYGQRVNFKVPSSYDTHIPKFLIQKL